MGEIRKYVIGPRDWSPEEEALLRDKFESLSTREIAHLLNRTYQSVKTRAGRLGLKRGRREWTAQEDAVICERYPHEKTANLIPLLDRTLGTIYRRAKKIGLDKTPEYLASPAACRLRRGDSE